MSENRPHNPSGPHNHDEIELLISRSLDGDLSVEETRRLAEAIEGSDALRDTARRYRALDALVRGWAARSPAEGDDAFATEVLARTPLEPVAASSEDRSRDENLDRVLAGFGAREIEVDWDRFSAAVAARIGPPQRSASGVMWAVRWAGGLAAAAMIGLVLIWSIPRGTTPSTTQLVAWESSKTVISEFEYDMGDAASIATVGSGDIARATSSTVTTLVSSDDGHTVIWERTAEATTEPAPSTRSDSGWAIVGAGRPSTRSFGALP